MAIMETDPATINRRTATTEDLGKLQQDFVVKTRDYKQQYAHLYFTRLVLMRQMVLTQAKLKWGM